MYCTYVRTDGLTYVQVLLVLVRYTRTYARAHVRVELCGRTDGRTDGGGTDGRTEIRIAFGLLPSRYARTHTDSESGGGGEKSQQIITHVCMWFSQKLNGDEDNDDS